jgi:hypothetical protein
MIPGIILSPLGSIRESRPRTKKVDIMSAGLNVCRACEKMRILGVETQVACRAVSERNRQLRTSESRIGRCSGNQWRARRFVHRIFNGLAPKENPSGVEVNLWLPFVEGNDVLNRAYLIAVPHQNLELHRMKSGVWGA